MKFDFMHGNYGWDNLSKFLLVVSIPFWFSRITLAIGVALAGYAIWRYASHDIQKRRREDRAFENAARKLLFRVIRFKEKKVFRNIGMWFASRNSRIQERRYHVIFKCPNCSQMLRVPRHKGSLIITCSKCGHKIKKKT